MILIPNGKLNCGNNNITYLWCIDSSLNGVPNLECYTRNPWAKENEGILHLLNIDNDGGIFWYKTRKPNTKRYIFTLTEDAIHEALDEKDTPNILFKAGFKTSGIIARKELE